MKWLMVVIFATVQGDVYIFKKPTFESREACIASVKDPEAQRQYVSKLVKEYGRVMPIHGINCLQEDELKAIMKEYGIPWGPKVRYNKT
jgi:hypothetical protein